MDVSEVDSRTSCSTCGRPLVGSACSACGGTGVPLALSDGVAGSASAYASEASGPELDLADEALKNGDPSRWVSHCLSAVGVSNVSLQTSPEGPSLSGTLRKMSLFVRVRTTHGDVTVETPVVRFPLTQYVPALRLLLELSDSDKNAVRYSARGELVMARHVGALSTASALCGAIENVSSAAIDAARLLVGAFQAREIGERDQKHLSLETIPRGILISDEVPTSSRRTRETTPAPPRKQPTRELLGAARPTPVAEVPAILMPPGGPGQRGKPTVSAQPAVAHQAPAAAPAARAVAPAAAPATLAAKPPPALKPPGATAVSAAPKPQPKPAEPREDRTPPTAPSPAELMTPRAPTRPPIAGSIDLAPPPPATAPRAGTRHAALCELLHKAQTLGAVLSFADQPATMCLLIRATVYRTILEHETAAPGAAAHLAHATAQLTKEIYITAPGKRRGSMTIPPTAPAFETMAEIVAKEGIVQAPEPLVIQPITTAQEAKQHLARYVSEIDQAPSDVDLRHFLALGALSELLVRAKLPPPTQERLRGILGHAKKEGAKQAVVDLMMTALNRMIA